MHMNLNDWVYSAQIEDVMARFNLAQGGEKDDMIDAVRAATLRAIQNNDYARSSELVAAFPNMRHWENVEDRRFKSKTRKDHCYGVLTHTAGAFVIGAVLFALKASGVSLGLLSDVRLIYGLGVISIALNCLGWFFRAEELVEGRKPINPSLEQQLGEWLSIGGMATFAMTLLLSVVQLVWLA